MARQQTPGNDIQRREFVVSVETEAHYGNRNARYSPE